MSGGECRRREMKTGGEMVKTAKSPEQRVDMLEERESLLKGEFGE